MRKLIVIATDHYVRNLVTAGAFDAIEDGETFYVASARGVRDTTSLAWRPGYLGTVAEPRKRLKPYAHLQNLLLVFYRTRSRTMRVKTQLLPVVQRLRYKLYALPGLRQLFVRRYLRRTGLNRDLHRIVENVRPDLIVAPSGGIDPLVIDSIRSARELGIPSLVLVHNWDNLSSKGAFPVRPDYLGVWGEQSADHAERIHGFPRDRVTLLGAPSFEQYFRHRPGSTPSPFPFRYALFAGCYAPFDELSALERLERAIDEQRLDLKVVYRPHPHRRPRKRPDYFDESRFQHVVLDPQMRELYLSRFAKGAERAKPRFPPLEYYPALFEHTEFVICPLSTMIVEAAIFEKRVIVIAYDDGIHRDSPATVVEFDHFEGIDRIEGFELCREAEALPQAFNRLAADRGSPNTPLREQIRYWLHHDERTYAQRLADLLDDIAATEGSRRAAVGAEAAYTLPPP